MNSQSTSNILMIRPAAFRMNEETASSNYYQKVLDNISSEEIVDKALEEFDNMVEILRSEGVNIIVFEDLPETDTPDALFPNNWISFHSNGKVALYPMYANNRRLERREDILFDLEHVHDFNVAEVIDFTEFENHSVFLEGTGSIVLDRIHSKAYAALSPRTDRNAFEQFCDTFDIVGICFESLQSVENHREQIYHTNVMMSIGTGWVAICLDSCDHPEDKEILENSFKENDLEIIALSEEQISHFAGNMLEVSSTLDDTPRIIMSKAAYESLDKTQVEKISKFGNIISIPLDIIEACGGGSARCMMAEVHLPKSNA